MTRITTPFNFHSTAAEVVEDIDLSGRRVVVTGGASGIGVETARALAGAGAEVTLAVRNPEAGATVTADITASTGNRGVHVAPLDLTDRASIAAFIASWRGPLHILVNNAGVMASPETYTPEGWELQFATNHLGHFARATGLRAALAAGADTVGEARIVAVSSSGHFRSPVIFDDLHFRYRQYDRVMAYGQSKTANVLFAVGATARWAGDGITANSLMPGAIRTNLQRYVDGQISSGEIAWKTTEQGASTSALLATSPLLKGIGGRYFVNNEEAVVVDRRTDDLTGVAPYALDPDNADRLWQVSEQLLG
jgi:NAD(P)-dependent dehydrogenase (short-subunit alcohol dehydrogenase family)